MITICQIPESTVRLVQDISAGLTKVHRRHPIESAEKVARARARREAREREIRIRRFRGLPVHNEECATHIADHVIEDGLRSGLIGFGVQERASVATLLNRNYQAQLRQRRREQRAASPGTSETQTDLAL